MKKARYFAEAKSIAGERFANVDGFNNFANGFSYADGAAGAGSNVMRYSPTDSSPYEITVTNANTTATAVTIFNSYVNRTAGNNGNVSGITIASAVDGVSYTGLLAQSESKNFECGMTYIQVVSGSNAALTATWSLTTKNADGNFETKTLSPKKSPMQQQADVLEYERTFKIDGYTNIVLTLPASTSVTYSYYPSATVALGRSLGNNPVMLDYTRPNITPATQMDLSSSAIAALRG